VAATLAEHHRNSLPRIRSTELGPSTGAGRRIDVVVPARNEAASIERCVKLLRLGRDVTSITVVDDGSEDDTSARARAGGASVRSTSGPPPGWLGKPHACHIGAEASAGPWLAFVDADVCLAPWTLAALVEHCEQTGADACSPLLRQDCTSLADRLLVPFAFWQYMVGLPGSAGRRTAGGARAILNGQCLVVRRSAYAASGGHAHPGVRGSVIEDSALARRLVESGHGVSLVRGPGAGSVRMYDGLAAVRAGFGKNVGGFLAADPARGMVVALGGISMVMVPRLAIGALCRPSLGVALGTLAAYGAGYAALVGAYREADEPGSLALAHPVTSVAMQAIATESVIRTALGRPPRWQGRSLDPMRPKA